MNETKTNWFGAKWAALSAGFRLKGWSAREILGALLAGVAVAGLGLGGVLALVSGSCFFYAVVFGATMNFVPAGGWALLGLKLLGWAGGWAALGGLCALGAGWAKEPKSDVKPKPEAEARA